MYSVNVSKWNHVRNILEQVSRGAGRFFYSNSNKDMGFLKKGGWEGGEVKGGYFDL